MRLAGWLETLDDAVNPIVVKELRQAVRSRFVAAMLTFFLIVQLVVLGGMMLLKGPQADPRQVDPLAGRHVFLVLQGIMLGTCMLFIPLYAGIRLTVERSDTNVDLLFVSTLKPRSIISGKLLAANVLTLLIFSACTPFMTFTYLMRGLDVPTILLVLAIDFLTVIGSVQATILLAVLPATRMFRGVLGLICLIGLLLSYVMTMGMTITLVEYGMRFENNWEFWADIGSIGIGALAVIGLLFSWSEALVSPPSANRALPVRIYTVTAWLVLGGICFGWSQFTATLEPMRVWMILSVLLFCLGIMISINERESWAPRVARCIPRRRWLRALAFFFYSGAAGGVLLSVLLIVLTLLFPLICEFFLALPLKGMIGPDLLPFEILSLLAAYVLGYALTSVLIRNWLLRKFVMQTQTYVLTLILLGVGFLGSVAMEFFYLQDTYAGRDLTPERPLWLFMNPIFALWDWENRFVYLLIASCWSGVSTILCLPWFREQILRFRPYESETVPMPDVAHAKP